MKKLLALTLALILAFSAAACGNSSGTAPAETTAAPAADNPAAETAAAIVEEVSEWCPKGSKIGFSTMTLGAEFFANLDDACEKYFTEAGYEYISASFEMNAATQVTDIENMINMGCHSILLFVSDEAAISDVCKRAVAEGIKVYPIATWVKDRDAYTFCQGTDQYKTGVGAATMAADWIDATFPDAADGSVEVVVIGNTATEESNDRTQGFYEVEKFTSKAKIVELFDLAGAADTNIKSQEYTDIIVSKYPNCKVVLCYGVDAELGVNEVIMRTNGIDYEHFAAFGVDTSMVAYQLIADSATNSSILRGTYNLGDDLGMSIFRLATGQNNDLADENGYISEDGTPVTVENVADFLK